MNSLEILLKSTRTLIAQQPKSARKTLESQLEQLTWAGDFYSIRKLQSALCSDGDFVLSNACAHNPFDPAFVPDETDTDFAHDYADYTDHDMQDFLEDFEEYNKSIANPEKATRTLYAPSTCEWLMLQTTGSFVLKAPVQQQITAIIDEVVLESTESETPAAETKDKVDFDDTFSDCSTNCDSTGFDEIMNADYNFASTKKSLPHAGFSRYSHNICPSPRYSPRRDPSPKNTKPSNLRSFAAASYTQPTRPPPESRSSSSGASA